jgi:hypothetical protein
VNRRLKPRFFLVDHDRGAEAPRYPKACELMRVLGVWNPTSRKECEKWGTQSVLLHMSVLTEGGQAAAAAVWK